MISFFKQLVIYTFLFGNVCAQNFLSGNIKDSLSNTPIYGATVTLQTNGKIESYAITDINGRFSIKYKSISDTIFLNLSHINYSRKLIGIDNFSNNHIFKLSPQKNTLSEVTVKSLPITKNGDTISYKVERFISKDDRVIGDLIKRLPGIAVAANGLITFNGKAISNYYIEGLDLLEGKYNLANNNINIEAVDKVQILENNQPIKVLDSNSVVTNPALNIKLKSNAVNKVYKNIETTAGLDTSILFGINFKLMRFAPKKQYLGGAKTNNYGDNYENDIVEHYTLDNIDELKKTENKESFLNMQNPTPPIISKTYSTLNKTSFVYYNGLKLLNNSKQLKYTIDFYKDNQNFYFNKTSNYYLPNNIITIIENQNTNAMRYLLRGSVKYVINRPGLYLSNKLKISVDKENDLNSIESTNPIVQKLSSDFLIASNDLMLYKKIGKKLVQANSYFSYSNLPAQVQISPGIFTDLYNHSLPYDLFVQSASIKNFKTTNSFSFKENFLGLLHKFNFLISYENALLKSEARINYNNKEIALSDSFRNNLSMSNFFTEVSNTMSYNKKRLTISVTLPIQIGNIVTENGLNSYDKSFVFFNPSAQVNYKISQYFDLGFNSLFKKEIGKNATNATGIIARSYRNLQQGQTTIPIEEIKPLSLSLSYKNIRKSIFGFVNTSILYSKSNLNFDQQYLGFTLINKYTTVANSFKSTFIVANISKYFRDIQLNVSLNTSLSGNRLNVILNSKNLVLKNNTTNYTFTTNTRAIKKTYIEITTQYISSGSKLQNQFSEKPFKQFNNSFTVSRSLGKLISIKNVINYYSSNLKQNNNWVFIDLGVNAKFKKCDLSIAANNLGNYKNFMWAEIGENTIIKNEYKLRGRNILLKLSTRL